MTAHLIAGSNTELPAREKFFSTGLYLLAAAAAALFWMTRAEEYSRSLSSLALFWLLFFIPPLLFVFSYSRRTFDPSTASVGPSRITIVAHAVAASACFAVFVSLGSAFWRNPLRDENAVALPAACLVAFAVFVVASGSLLARKRSSLAGLAAVLFWPYWLVLGLTFVGRFFEASPIRTAFCFLCFLVPVLFAFAAGAASWRPRLGHACAFAAVIAAPWVYWTTLQDTPLGNVWTDFNVPDGELSMYRNLWPVKLTIVAVALMVFAILAAGFRLLPVRWKFRGHPMRERAWPAVVGTLLFLAVWFGESAMPYRISGAVDYGRWPIFQILHVKKRGAQFHEEGVSVWGYQDRASQVTFSGNDRRWFQYRFKQSHASAELPAPLAERVRVMMHTAQIQKRDVAGPLRAWNVDAWYVTGIESGMAAYRSDQGAEPPQAVVDLFGDLEKIPHNSVGRSDRKDICLGFCYDPAAGLGLLYANSRCPYDSERKSYVCR